MKPPPFEYVAPTSLDEAVELLSPSLTVRLLAGGQSLMPMLNMRFVLPDRVIDLNRIDELSFIQARGDEIVIGSMTRQRALQRSELVGTQLPLLTMALHHVGHLQTRNRGTIGGSLCHLDPAAELPAVARAYDAILEVHGPAGRRDVAMADFAAYYMTPALEADEILAAIRIRPWTGRCGCAFREFARRHGDFAIAGALVLLEAAQDGRIARASLTAFGISQAPIRIDRAESMLVGQTPDRELLAAAAQECMALSSLEDPYASAEYRGHVARAMMARALGDAVAQIAMNH